MHFTLIQSNSNTIELQPLLDELEDVLSHGIFKEFLCMRDIVLENTVVVSVQQRDRVKITADVFIHHLNFLLYDNIVFVYKTKYNQFMGKI